MDENRPGYYAIIPADVRYDDRIPPNAKLLYGEISALIGAGGYCYASNQYFARIYGMSVDTISRLFKKLEDNGYIKREIEKDRSGQVVRRKVYLCASVPQIQPPDFFTDTPPQKNREGTCKKVGETNTSNTDLKENKKEKPQPLDDEALKNLFIDWIRAVSGEEWTNRERNAVYLALERFYAPREKAKQNPARSEAGFTALSGRLVRLSGCNPALMVEMLDIATTSLWKSVFPLNGKAAQPEAVSADKEEEEWLN